MLSPSPVAPSISSKGSPPVSMARSIASPAALRKRAFRSVLLSMMRSAACNALRLSEPHIAASGWRYATGLRAAGGWGDVAGKRRRDYSVRMNKALRDQAMELPPEERLELGYDLIESVPEAGADFELTDEQRAEIERRMAEHERDPGSAIPWEVVRERLRAKYGRRGGLPSARQLRLISTL